MINIEDHGDKVEQTRGSIFTRKCEWGENLHNED